MRLLYEWIDESANGIIEKQGFCFADDYSIAYDEKTHTLNIQEIFSPVPKGFYTVGEKNTVEDITCVLGRNGSGKTTLLKHLYGSDFLPARDREGKRNRQESTIKVIEDRGYLNICHNQDNLTVCCQKPYNVYDFANFDTATTPKIDRTTIFVSNDRYVALNLNFTEEGHQSKMAFTPYDLHIANSLFWDMLTGNDHSLFVYRDLVYYFNRHAAEDSNEMYFRNVLYLLLLKTLIRDGKREEFDYFRGAVVTFQLLEHSDAFLNICSMFNVLGIPPENILFGRCDWTKTEDKKRAFNLRLDREQILIAAAYKHVSSATKENRDTIYGALRINLATELLLSLLDFNPKSVPDLTVEGLLSRFKDCIQSNSVSLDERALAVKRKELSTFENARADIETLRKFVPVITKRAAFPVDDEPNFLDYIEKSLQSKRCFPLKYLWFHYGCSAGERAFLDLFSYLNCMSCLPLLFPSARSGINKNVLLLLDEPDLYCHPEWQRKLLFSVIETLERLYPEHKFQIILSTHSPLLLSDLPKEDILLLDDGKGSIGQSFGANLFDLYDNQFFLDSFIGEFAKRKISLLISKVVKMRDTNSVDRDELQSIKGEIGLIGEPILKNKLLKMISSIEARE